MISAMKHASALLAIGIAFATPAPASDAPANKTDGLVPGLADKAPPQETLQGVITAIDERNDRVTLRLVSDDISEFKVQDGLIFNAIHHGDRVEITVENVAGAKTIVGLKRL